MQRKRARVPSLTQQSQSQLSVGAPAKARKGKAQRSLVTYKRKTDIPRWGFPRRLYIAHRYVETLALQVNLGGVTGLAFKANGLFDPNSQVGGHQPMYFDNLTAIYQHYTVVKSTIKVTVVPTDNTIVGFRRVALYNDDDASPGATLNAAAEMANSQIRIIPFGQCTPTYLYSSWSARATFGGDPLSNDQLQGTSATDPPELTQYMIRADGLAGYTQDLGVTVEIVYYTIWDELKTQDVN